MNCGVNTDEHVLHRMSVPFVLSKEGQLCKKTESIQLRKLRE